MENKKTCASLNIILTVGGSRAMALNMSIGYKVGLLTRVVENKNTYASLNMILTVGGSSGHK